ncbi:MAG: lipid-A-disaccharide synthase, partial [Verrucomicrobia bacterium]|nr:lipid-A-disaccharide synthase [Verrucomicrobiota bacterium]
KDRWSGLSGGPSRVELVAGETRQILRQARAAMVASGTATIETALMECPQIVVYKTSWATYVAGKMLVRVPHLGMVNLVAGRRLCPELIQGAATPAALASAVEPLLADTPERAAMLEGLREVSRALGSGGAAERAAAILLEELT